MGREAAVGSIGNKRIGEGRGKHMTWLQEREGLRGGDVHDGGKGRYGQGI